MLGSTVGAVVDGGVVGVWVATGLDVTGATLGAEEGGLCGDIGLVVVVAAAASSTASRSVAAPNDVCSALMVAV